MRARRIGVVFIALAAAAYVAGFAAEHAVDYDEASAGQQQIIEWAWDAMLLLPLVAVGVSTYLWPRLWVVLAAAGILFLLPFAAHEIELAAGLKEPLGPACDPCIDTTFLSVLAVPALVIGIVGLGIGRWRRHAREQGAT